MSDSSEVFLYVPDTEELAHFFEEWPDKIGLAVINGLEDTEPRVFHVDERDQVFAEIAESMGLAPGELRVVPEIEGYETVSIRFSEEQRLIALIEEMTALEDEAHDHLGNFEFYRDQGLDTETLHDRRERPLAADDEPADTSPEGPVQTASQWSRPGNDHGFEAVYPEARLTRGRSSVELCLGANDTSGEGLSIPIFNVLFDDTLGAFKFRLPETYPRHGVPPHPEVTFVFSENAITEDLYELLVGRNGRKAHVAFSDEEFIVTLLDFVPAPAPAASPKVSSPLASLNGRDWVLVGSGLLASIALVSSIVLFVMLQTFDPRPVTDEATAQEAASTEEQASGVQLDGSYLDELEQRIFSRIEDRTDDTGEDSSR